MSSSFYHEKFGDVTKYHLISPNPEFDHTRRLSPPDGCRFSATEWAEFLTYLQSCQRKIKAAFRGGQILIEECSTFGATEAGLNVMIGSVYGYNREAVGYGDDVLEAVGKRHLHISEDVLMPDVTWVPQHGVGPSIFFEIANQQEPHNLLSKVDQILRNSSNLRYVIIVKVWRDPQPERVAIVMAVWVKANDIAEGNEWKAVKFTSFGNRPPTSAELATFSVTPGDRPWVPTLDGVTDGPDNIPCDVTNSAHSVFTLPLLPIHMFNVPDLTTPAHLLALPDLVIQLLLVKKAIVQGMVMDILTDHWVLTGAQYEGILTSEEAQRNYPRLYQHALQRTQPIPV